jgi:hypothetical protein
VADQPRQSFAFYGAKTSPKAKGQNLVGVLLAFFYAKTCILVPFLYNSFTIKIGLKMA